MCGCYVQYVPGYFCGRCAGKGLYRATPVVTRDAVLGVSSSTGSNDTQIKILRTTVAHYCPQ